MITPNGSRPCIQGATIDIDVKLSSLPDSILWGLGQKVSRIDPLLLYGEIHVPISNFRKLLFRYKLATKFLGGPVVKTDDGMPVVIIYAIERVIFGIKPSRLISMLRPKYVIAFIAYYISKYTE